MDKKEKYIQEYLNNLLDTPFSEDKLIEIFLMFEDAKKIKVDHDNFSLSYENDDGDIEEVDMHEMVEKIKTFAFCGCQGDFDMLYNKVTNYEEKSKN